MIIVRVLFMLLILLGSAGTSPAQPSGDASEPAGDETAIVSIRRAIEASKDDGEKALLYKKMGDLYVSRDDYKNAAGEYIRALSLKNAFSARERLQMAVAISWGDRLDEAAAEFRSLIREDPQNSEARVHLARALSWSGRFDESLAEVDQVLKQDPGSKDALLIKANDLRWKGEADEALPLYRSILEKGEDFDARLGYTYALFDCGDLAEARKSMALLKPVYPYQENELKKLQEELKRPKSAQPVQGDVKYTHYRDNDGNDVDRYMASFGFPAGKWKNSISSVHTEANDYVRRNSADMVFGETRVPLTRRFSLGAGIGVIRFRNSADSNFLLGRLNADADMPWASVGLSLASEPLTDTAQIIEKRIRVAAARIYLSRGLAERFFLYGSYGYVDYSDSNNSHDFLLSPRYVLVQGNPRVTIGYRFRYLNFDRQSFGGYFDPENFLSHQIFTNASFEAGRYFGFAEIFAGQQSYTRYDVGHNEGIYGGTGALGYKLSQHVSVEVSAEGGNYALQSASGFTSFLYGIRLTGTW